ncbi:unnamed protein product [Adineta steineri]|uniref:Hint domain-containing protein n=1 Tax=Adineta steineri TaxID=433720 RepID=A0A815DQT1_9BILA|nr:unnamed protein product [Adineta steineri]CAF1577084.1 unnamed protein product [Adineta steineri]
MQVHGRKIIFIFMFALTFIVTLANSTCYSQSCGKYSSGCSTNGNCVCFQMANGTGLCATNLVSYADLSPCTGNLSCTENNTICVLNSCFGQPLCYPLTRANSSICPPSNGSMSTNPRSTVTIIQTVTQIETQTVAPVQPFRPVCFHGETTVLKQDGSICLMRNLAVGDRILASREYQSPLVWSTVLAVDVYQYYNEKKPIEYLEIHTSSLSPALYITPAHSLLLKKYNNIQPRYTFANEARVGDYIYLINGEQTLEEVTITYIRTRKFYDAYAPLTFEGNFIVNNVLVSAYGTFKHEVAHYLIKAPRRWWLRLCSILFQKHITERLDNFFLYMIIDV